MNFSLRNLLTFIAIVSITLGVELGFGLSGLLLYHTSMRGFGFIPILLFIFALVLPAAMPLTTKPNWQTNWIPVAIGLCSTMALFVALGGLWADPVYLRRSLFFTTLVWSCVTIALSCWGAWRSLARYVVAIPILTFALCLAVNLIPY